MADPQSSFLPSFHARNQPPQGPNQADDNFMQGPVQDMSSSVGNDELLLHCQLYIPTTKFLFRGCRVLNAPVSNDFHFYVSIGMHAKMYMQNFYQQIFGTTQLDMPIQVAERPFQYNINPCSASRAESMYWNISVYCYQVNHALLTKKSLILNCFKENIRLVFLKDKDRRNEVMLKRFFDKICRECIDVNNRNQKLRLQRRMFNELPAKFARYLKKSNQNENQDPNRNWNQNRNEGKKDKTENQMLACVRFHANRPLCEEVARIYKQQVCDYASRLSWASNSYEDVRNYREFYGRYAMFLQVGRSIPRVKRWTNSCLEMDLPICPDNFNQVYFSSSPGWRTLLQMDLQPVNLPDGSVIETLRLKMKDFLPKGLTVGLGYICSVKLEDAANLMPEVSEVNIEMKSIQFYKICEVDPYYSITIHLYMLPSYVHIESVDYFEFCKMKATFFEWLGGEAVNIRLDNKGNSGLVYKLLNSEDTQMGVNADGAPKAINRSSLNRLMHAMHNGPYLPEEQQITRGMYTRFPSYGTIKSRFIVMNREDVASGTVRLNYCSTKEYERTCRALVDDIKKVMTRVLIHFAIRIADCYVQNQGIDEKFRYWNEIYREGVRQAQQFCPKAPYSWSFKPCAWRPKPPRQLDDDNPQAEAPAPAPAPAPIQRQILDPEQFGSVHEPLRTDKLPQLEWIYADHNAPF